MTASAGIGFCRILLWSGLVVRRPGGQMLPPVMTKVLQQLGAVVGGSGTASALRQSSTAHAVAAPLILIP
jgi:hypothetical protein